MSSGQFQLMNNNLIIREGFGSCSLSCLLASRFQPPILHDPRHSYLEARLVYGLV